MGTTYSGYYDEPLYNIVGGPLADVNHTAMDRELFKENAMPWDRLLTGGYMSLIYFLWLAIMVFLNFCLFTYVLEWAIQINFILVLTEGSVVVVGLIWSCIWAAMGDNDIKKLAYAGADNVSLLGMLHARRSRANNSTDVSLMISGLFLVVFELWFVCVYIYGGLHNNWLNGWSSTVNYPLTRTATFATLTAANVQQVMFRAFIHLFIVIKGLILICAIFFTRANAVDLNDHRERTFAKLKRQGEKATASAEDVLHLGARNGQQGVVRSALKQ
jgi:hypothetical protein